MKCKVDGCNGSVRYKEAQRLASEQPLPKNGYVRVAQRTRSTFAGVNSVFGLGMDCQTSIPHARAHL